MRHRQWEGSSAPDPFLSRVGDAPLDEDQVLLLLLLPLVMVAWADGAIEGHERRLLLDLARGEEFLPGDTHDVLKRWLEVRPTDAEFGDGFRVLRDHLRRRDRGDGEHPELRANLVQLAERLAHGRTAYSPVREVIGVEWEALDQVQALLWMGENETWEELELWLEGQVQEFKA
jgi:hypothetical protein